MYGLIFFYGIGDKPAHYRLMVSDNQRPWIRATPGASQVHYRPLRNGEGDGEMGWSMGLWYPYSPGES